MPNASALSTMPINEIVPNIIKFGCWTGVIYALVIWVIIRL